MEASNTLTVTRGEGRQGEGDKCRKKENGLGKGYLCMTHGHGHQGGD